MMSYISRCFLALSSAVILLMATGAVLPTKSSITSAQPATTITPGDETQPYLVLIPQGGPSNVVEQNTTVGAYGRNFCSTEECSAVTLSIGNEFVGNRTIANVTVQDDGTFATNFTVNVPFPFRYGVTANQTASNGTVFTASMPIMVPVGDPKEKEGEVEGEETPQPASIGVHPSPFFGDIIPVGPPIPSASGISDFNPNIPYGGRGVAVDVSPANSAVAIVASESGGLWKTTDAGATWSHLDGLPIFDMSDVKFAPGNDQIVITTGLAVSYTTNNGGGIWRSTDGGSSWTKPPTADPAPAFSCPSRFNAYGISFAPGTNDVFVGTDCGLSVSHDLGATWTHVVPNSGSATPRVNGVNAQRAGSSGSSIVDTCGVGGHYRSADGGATWTPTNTASPQCLWYVHVIAASPLEPDVLFAAVDGRQLYESDDRGATWTNLNPNQDICCGRGPWVATRLSSDGDPNHFDIYFGGGSGNNVIRQTCTNTGGPGLRCSTSWNTVLMQHGDQNGLAFSSSDNCAQYIVTDGGIETTSDCGATWRLTGSGMGGYRALQVYEVTGQVHPDHTDLYFGTQDNDLWASGDNGATWPNNVHWEGFFIQTPHSSATDSGQTTTFRSCAGCSNQQSAAHFTSVASWNNPPGGGENPRLIEQGVYIQWSSPSPPTSQLHLTTTGGATWTAVTGASTTLQLYGYPQISGDPANPVIYQGVVRPGHVIGLIKITGVRTGAATITDADSGLNNVGTFPTMFPWHSVFAVDPSNPQHLIAADAGAGQMVVSTNGGTTWTPNVPLTNLVTNFGQFDFTIRCENIHSCFTQTTNIAFDPTNGNRILVGSHQAGIFASLDGGATWGVLLGSNLVPHVSSFFFDEVRNEVIASSYGRGLWKLDLTAINRPPVANDQSVTTNQNTPVPITLAASDPDGDPITYSIERRPSHGDPDMFNPSTGTVTYVPVPSYFGSDSFTFKATDNRGAESNIATVSIEVEGPPDCNNPTIVGNDNRNDVIRGTIGNDIIDGLGGNDVIFGNGGNDEICGGNGNDVINSGDGDERISSGAGSDVINSGAGNDQLYGLEGGDVINSGPGDDLIDGGPDSDIGNAGPGDDYCFNVETASNCEA